LLRTWGDASSAAAKPAERAQQEIADHKDDDSAYAEAAGDKRQKAAEPSSTKTAAAKAHASATGIVDEIAALAFVAKPHSAFLLRLPNAQAMAAVAIRVRNVIAILASTE
jgi:hypothetical protein